jgi:hypothetical protein
VSNQRAEEESSFSSLITRLVGHYGLAREALSFYPVMSVILEALPLFQALLLMGGIVLYPVWILLCNYNLQALSRYMMIWLSVQCWTYLWALSQHVDNVLIQTFYPGLSIDWAGKILIDMVALVMYIVLPLCCTASFFWIRR